MTLASSPQQGHNCRNSAIQLLNRKPRLKNLAIHVPLHTERNTTREVVLEALASGRLNEPITFEVQPRVLHVSVEWTADERAKISEFAQRHGFSFEGAVAALVVLRDRIQTDFLHAQEQCRERREENLRVMQERERERRNANRREQREMDKRRGRFR